METNEAFRADILKSRAPQEIIGKIKEAGYEVTPQEIFDAFKIDINDELSDEELAGVAGGYIEEIDRHMLKLLERWELMPSYR